MSRKSKSQLFNIESLEGRTLLSGVPASFHKSTVVPIELSAARVTTAATSVGAKSSNSFLKLAEATNSTTIKLQFRQPIPKALVKNLRFEASGLQILKSQFAPDRRSVTLTTSAQSDTTYSLKVTVLKGPVKKPRISTQGLTNVHGAPAPLITNMASGSSSSVTVTFSEPMSDKALDRKFYTIVDASGKPLSITDARFDGMSHKVVILSTAAQDAGPYKLSIMGVTDL